MEAHGERIANGDGPFKPYVDSGQKPTSKIELWKMRNINLTVTPGQLVMVAGSVGSGKSSLLRVFLNEIIKISGSVKVNGQVSYVSQQAWIANDTLRNNILFGSTYNESHYRRTIRVCGLEPDLKSFASGDQLMIGERGINLSGGQKARVGLARAVYASSSIVLMDSPLGSSGFACRRSYF